MQCKKCKKRPVYCKKRQLCRICYQAERLKNLKEFEPKGPYSKKYRSRFKVSASGRDPFIGLREMTFIKNYFVHSNWAPQPCTFHLEGFNYTPDFYDGDKNVFIEVAGTRQAYYSNRKKYKKFQELFPLIVLEVRSEDGTLILDDLEGKTKLMNSKVSSQEQFIEKT